MRKLNLITAFLLLPKKLFFITLHITLFLNNSFSQSGWQVQIIGSVSTNFISSNFINDETGWVVGSSGAILKTIDRGQNWSLISSNAAGPIYTICFINESTGFIGGDSKFKKSTNGGLTWSDINLNIVYALRSIHFINENTGWAAGTGLEFNWTIDQGLLLKTTNAGLNWSVKYNTESDFYYDVFFINDETGWIVGERSKVYKTTNGGITYNQQSSSLGTYLNSVYFINENTGWIAAREGRISKTINGGSNWSVKYISNNPLNSIFFINQFSGWCAGISGKILHSSDGGENWIDQVSSANVTLEDVKFFNAQTGLIFGWNSTILRTNSGGITRVELVSSVIPEKYNLYQNYPNPFNPSTAISFDIPKESRVTLKIYDVTGKEVAVLVNNEIQQVGTYNISFNGSRLASGIYIYRLETGSLVVSKKMILLK